MRLVSKKSIKKLLNRSLGRYGLQIVNSYSHQTLQELARDHTKLKLLQALPIDLSQRITYSDILNSTSQLGADLLALALTGKSRGVFVEFGACDGKTLSNSYLLEKYHGWQGVLSEPSTVWHEQLYKNRKCKIETKCVGERSGEQVRFSEVERPEFSGLSSLSSNKDEKSDVIKISLVETISLNELLKNSISHKFINYLSVDTEGGEYKILSSLNWNTWSFDFVSVEHNYSDEERHLETLFIEKGYTRVLDDISDFDAWFLRNDLFKKYWGS